MRDPLTLVSEPGSQAFVEFSYDVRVLADAMDGAGALGAVAVLARKCVGQPADLSYAPEADLRVPGRAEELKAHILEVLCVICAWLHSLDPWPGDGA